MQHRWIDIAKSTVGQISVSFGISLRTYFKHSISVSWREESSNFQKSLTLALNLYESLFQIKEKKIGTKKKRFNFFIFVSSSFGSHKQCMQGRGLIATLKNYSHLVGTYQHVTYCRHGDNIFINFGLISAWGFRHII